MTNGPLSRRTVLAAGVAAAGGLGAAGWWLRRRPNGRSRVELLAETFLRTPEPDILAATARALDDGATAAEVLAASFAMPLIVGGDDEDVHVLLVVPSIALHVAHAADRTERLLPVFWCVHNARTWPASSQRRGRAAPVSQPQVALARAFLDGDASSADAAIASLVGDVGLTEAMAQLRAEGSRRRVDPHAAIYAAQASRIADRLPAPFQLELARSLARHLARTGPPHDDPEPLATHNEDTTTPLEIARALRDSPRPALGGLSARAIWEALAMLALGTRVDDPSPSGLGVHQTTLLDALWFLHDAAPKEARALVLARAVPAVPGVSNPVTPAMAPRLVPEPTSGDSGRLLTLRQAEARARHNLFAFTAEMRREVASKGTSEHDFKYFSALDTVAGKLSADFRPRWWAGTALAHPVGSAYRWERAEEAERLIARLR